MRFRIGPALVLLGLILAILQWNAHAVGARHIDDSRCRLEPALSGLSVPLATTELHSIPLPDGPLKLKCHFDIPEGHEPARTLVKRGFVCGTFRGTTTRSTLILTPGGSAHLSCQL